MAIGDKLISIDISFSRISLIIGEVNNFNQINIIEMLSEKCFVYDENSKMQIENIQLCISSLLKKAEEKTSFNISSTYLTIPGKYSNIIQIEAVKETEDKFSGVTDKDIIYCIEEAKQKNVPEEEISIDIIPYKFVLDNGNMLDDPKGKFTKNLTLLAQIITVKKEYLENILEIFEKIDVEIDGLVPVPLAERNVLLEKNELKDNVLTLDFNENTTELGIFVGNAYIYSNTYKYGGKYITEKIAEGLNIEFEEAEKLKKQYGLALKSYIENDNNILLTTQKSKDPKSKRIKVSDVISIIEKTVNEIFEVINYDITSKGLKQYINSVIITGIGIAKIKEADKAGLIVFNLPVKFATSKLLGTIKYRYLANYALLRYVAEKPFVIEKASKVENKQKKSKLKKIVEKIKDFFYSE